MKLHTVLGLDVMDATLTKRKPTGISRLGGISRLVFENSFAEMLLGFPHGDNDINQFRIIVPDKKACQLPCLPGLPRRKKRLRTSTGVVK